MPKFSVFTPSHETTYLNDAYQSLKAQTFEDWEWVVVLNNGAVWTPPSDPRVRVYHEKVSGVGHAKYVATSFCKGTYLVELDHDDLLTPDCLNELLTAFKSHPRASLVYSQWVHIDDKGKFDPLRFDAEHGWLTEPFAEDFSHKVLDPTPHNVSLIWYAPNHVRAFKRKSFLEIGGYNAALQVLDDQELMSRLYQVGEFYSIPKVLYKQRLHTGNTQRNQELNNSIQIGTWDLYEKNIEANAQKWAERKGLTVIEANSSLLYRCEENSVGVIKAIDYLNKNEPETIRQFHDLLAPNGMLLTLTPSTDGRGAFMHHAKTFWNENTFWQYINPKYPLFQISRLRSFYPSDWHKEHDIMYVQANLIALKEGYTRDGGLL